MAPTPPLVAWTQPIGSKIDPLTFRSYRETRWPGPHHHIDCSGIAVATARNLLTAEALRSPGVTHVWMVDSDMTWEPDALLKLLARDLPIVGGLCFDRRPPFKPILGRYMPPEWGYDKGAMGWLYDFPPADLIDVDATGGAFLLVTREVFEAIREKFGDGPEWEGWWTPLPEHQQAEDLSFCARAKACGFDVKVDTAVRVGHIAAEGIIVDEEFAKRNRRFEAHRWNPPWSPRRAIDGATRPVASIVIPTFNQKPAFLVAAVRSALAQTVPVEVIVVDDGSDERAEIELLTAIDDISNVIYLRHDENQGIAAALNTGIAAMKTSWFCWLSSDDLFMPDKVEAQLAALLAVNGRAGCHNYNVQVDNGTTVRAASVPGWRTMAEQNEVLSRCCAVNGSTVMIHRDVLDATRLSNGDYFDTSYRYSQDWEMWRRVGARFFWHPQWDILGTRREFDNLTARLIKQQGPNWLRKVAEDETIMAMTFDGPTK